MAIEQIDVLLTLMIHINDPAKDLKKVVTKLAKKQTLGGRVRLKPNSVIQRALNAKNISNEIWSCMLDLDAINYSLQEFVKTGHHGFVEFENMIFPVKLQQFFTEEGRPVEETHITQEDLDWANKNEDTVKIAVAHAFKNEFNQKHITVDVLLFSEYGFSGTRETITAMNIHNPHGSKRIGDTQYYE